MSVGSRVTFSSGFEGGEGSVVSSAGLVIGAAVPAVVAGACVILGGAEVRTGGTLVVVRAVVRVVVGAVVVTGALVVADGLGADVVAVGVAVSVGSAGCWASCERAVNSSAPATTIARKPTLITLAATRWVGFVGSVISGSYGDSGLPATRGANLF